MDGAGQQLENLIKQHVASCPPERPYTFVEVGSAGCVSLRAFADIIKDARGGAPWRVVGFDLPPGKAWSVDMAEVKRSFDGLPYQLISEPTTALPEGMSLCLMEDPRSYLLNTFPFPIDFAFIDGCHGKCAGRDFLSVEPKVSMGGLVAFHDYGEIEQGTDWQAHCREFISVRTYVHRLGLAAPCVTPRKGWRFVGEAFGSRRSGGDGNSVAAVQRTTEPLCPQPELSLD